MKSIKTAVYVCVSQICSGFMSVRVWIGYLVGILLTAVPVWNYLQYAGGNPVYIGEGILTALVNPVNHFVIFCGLMLCLSDSPFVTERSSMMIYRTSKKIWGYSMAFYTGIQTVLYYTVIFAASFLISSRKGYMGSVWSSVMYRWSTQGGAAAGSNYGISPPNIALLQSASPWKAVLISWVLLCICGYSLTLLLFVLNLAAQRMLGYAIVLGIQFLGMSVSGNYIMWVPGRFLPLILSNYDQIIQRGIPLLYALAEFVLMLLVLFSILDVIIKKIDFKIAAGEKTG